MKISNISIALVICIFLCACKAVKLENDLGVAFNTITSTFIDQELDKKKQYNPDKNKLQLFIHIMTDKKIVETSKFVINIDFYNKQNLDGVTDSIFSYDGVETYFGGIPKEYKILFNKKFKELAGDEISKPIGEIYALTDPFASIAIAFNDDNEIEYINPPYDKIYYELLKDKVEFAPNWK